MKPTARSFRQDLGTQLCSALGDEYKFFKSHDELRAPAPEGHNVIVLSGSNKHSPYVAVTFYFGKNFGVAKRLEKVLGSEPVAYHIQQYSSGRQPLYATTYQGPDTWEIDITAPSPTLVPEIIAAIHGMANPFFARFSAIRAARDAIAADDPGCFGGPAFWRRLLLLDAAMSDLPHFERWAERLNEFDRKQANEAVSEYRRALHHAV